MSHLKPLSFLFLAVALVACGAPQVGTEASEPLGTTTIESELASTETLITFRGDWNITLSSPIIAGGKVRVAYDASRLPTCRGNVNGKPAWTITGFYQINGGPVGMFEAGGHSPSGGTEPPVFDVPVSGDLAIWFQNNDRWGCNSYDSRFGYNYHFNIQSTPTVHFRGDWTTQVSGTPGAASTLSVTYDLSRLPNCRASYNGYATWDILAYARFDGGAVVSASVTAPAAGGRTAVPAVFNVPPGAGVVELWFSNSDRTSCSSWDSNYGYNYRFVLR